MNALGKLFLKGLAVVIPVTLTLAILWWFARGAEQFLGGLLIKILPHGWYIPGMGLLSALAITMLVGLLTHVILFQKLFAIGDAIFHRLPLVKTIYSALKDFIGYLSPDSKVAMSKVVLVRVPGQEFEQIGFVTMQADRLGAALPGLTVIFGDVEVGPRVSVGLRRQNSHPQGPCHEDYHANSWHAR